MVGLILGFVVILSVIGAMVALLVHVCSPALPRRVLVAIGLITPLVVFAGLDGAALFYTRSTPALIPGSRWILSPQATLGSSGRVLVVQAPCPVVVGQLVPISLNGPVLATIKGLDPVTIQLQDPTRSCIQLLSVPQSVFVWGHKLP